MNAKEQNKLAGIFLLIHGGLQALIMAFLGIIYGGMGAIVFASARRSQDQMAGIIIIVVMIVVIAIIASIFVLPQLIGGWKMLKERPGARTWGIIGSIVACLSFPLGTAAGVFGLVFLFGQEGQNFYLGGGQYQQNMFNPQQNVYNPPPPPNNWQ